MDAPSPTTSPSAGLGASSLSSAVLPQGASGATAGLITPLWHVDHTHHALFDMGLRSLNAFPDLAADLAESGADPGLRQCGVLKVAVTQEEVETLKDDFAWQGEMGLGVTWLDPDEIFEREPELSQETLGGVFSPHEGYVSGQRLVDSLMHAATQRGTTLLEGEEVSGLETDGRRVTGVPYRKRCLPCGSHSSSGRALDRNSKPLDRQPHSYPTHQGTARLAQEGRISPRLRSAQLHRDKRCLRQTVPSWWGRHGMRESSIRKSRQTL